MATSSGYTPASGIPSPNATVLQYTTAAGVREEVEVVRVVDAAGLETRTYRSTVSPYGIVNLTAAEETTLGNPNRYVVRAHHADVIPGAPWVPASGIPFGFTLTGLSYTVISGTATVVDQDGTSIANIPAGFSSSWEAGSPNDGTLLPVTSITSVGGRILVTMSVV
jgi:hypothetical protein